MLEEFDPTGIERVLCVVAHPDDMEYGGSAVVAKWTAQGISARYLLLTGGSAGIRNLPPEECRVVRTLEQQEACRVVGAELTILDFPDGLVEYSLDLRKAITAHIREFRPQAVMVTNFDLRARWGLNHADHRVCGLATVDAIRDADNPWIFPETGEAFKAERLLVSGAANPTHFVDVSGEAFEAGVASLAAHQQYLDSLGDYPSARELYDGFTRETGAEVGVANALGLTVYDM